LARGYAFCLLLLYRPKSRRLTLARTSLLYISFFVSCLPSSDWERAVILRTSSSVAVVVAAPDLLQLRVGGGCLGVKETGGSLSMHIPPIDKANSLQSFHFQCKYSTLTLTSSIWPSLFLFFCNFPIRNCQVFFGLDEFCWKVALGQRLL
jgi:hypothetical protein